MKLTLLVGLLVLSVLVDCSPLLKKRGSRKTLKGDTVEAEVKEEAVEEEEDAGKAIHLKHDSVEDSGHKEDHWEGHMDVAAFMALAKPCNCQQACDCDKKEGDAKGVPNLEFLY